MERRCSPHAVAQALRGGRAGRPLGVGPSPQALRDPVRVSDAPASTRLSVFPLPGAILFPRMHLPLHIFEPRYRALVGDALARDRRIGMIQPRGPARDPKGPPLFDVGCVGKIADVEALDDGRYNIVLEGLSRFRIVRELDVTTSFRQVEAVLEPTPAGEILNLGERAALEAESRRFADIHGYAVDWEGVARL
ncbi:MAG: hypothetical protein FJ335_10015, partial [Sphingomonadales bacterium]|nr:hypothetical protein [Sphingomonadales bacterium]